MSNDMVLYVIIFLLVVVFIGIGVRFYLKNKKPSKKNLKKSGVAIEQLIGYLGGKGNIKGVSSTLSKVNVELADVKAVDIDGIKKLGATGIVQNQDKLAMIFGKVSEAIEYEIKEKL